MALHSSIGFEPINAISICTGGEGLDLGLELAIPGYRAMTCSSMRAEMRALIRMAIRAERAGQRRGFTRPSYRKSLNARFVAWLMGCGPLNPDRIDALRMLGNGVVSLAGAHAIRTLGIALAWRYGADPARFVWGAA